MNFNICVINKCYNVCIFDLILIKKNIIIVININWRGKIIKRKRNINGSF